MAVKLDRLPIDWQNRPSLVRRYWDNSMKKIEETLNAILAIPEIEEALANLDAATENANNAAEETRAETSIVNSYPADFAGDLISADSTGNITIANHNRKYGNGTSVAVTGDTFATTAVSTEIVRIYYDDASRAGGPVTYSYTIDPADPPVQGGNRHVVGAVEIPAAGSQGGTRVTPPGYVIIN